MSRINTLEIVDKFYGVLQSKGDLLVCDGASNVRLPVGIDNYVLTSDSTQASGIKWAPSTGGISYNLITLATTPVSTNSTTPQIISEFTSTPASGSYVFMLNMTYTLTRTNRTMAIGFYKNGTLIPGSTRTVEIGAVNRRTPFFIQFSALLNGTDIFTIRFNTNNTDTSAIIYEGNLSLVRYSSVAQVNSTTTFSTNSTGPVLVSDTTATPGAGAYLILMSGTYSLTQTNRTATLYLYKDNSALISRTIQSSANAPICFELSTIATLTSGESINLRVNVSNSGTTCSLYNRTLIFIQL